MNKEIIFTDIQKWLFENYYHCREDNSREGDPFIFSLDFESWLRD